MPLDDGNPRTGCAALAAAAGLAAVHALPALAKPIPALGALLGIDSRTRSGDGVAVTFDDGPHPSATPAVLETLREHGARATFFLVGEQVARSRALAAEIVAAGHGVALHCDRHRNLLRLTPRQLRDDLDRASDRIATATGIVPDVHRAPYGTYSAAGVWLVRRRGLRPVLWTHDGRDWSGRATPRSIAGELTSGLRPGSVLLLHDSDAYSSPGSWRNTVAALPEVLERIEAAGLPHFSP